MIIICLFSIRRALGDGDTSSPEYETGSCRWVPGPSASMWGKEQLAGEMYAAYPDYLVNVVVFFMHFPLELCAIDWIPFQGAFICLFALFEALLVTAASR